MADYYLVEQGPGPDWDPARGRREQAGWDEHAAFMDALAADGVIVLGGPTGERENGLVLLVADVDGEDEIRARLGEDPWSDTILRIVSVRPWSIWLRSSADPAA